MCPICFQSLKSNTQTPIFQCHGEADPLVRPDFGELTSKALSQINKKHKYKTYPGMGHSSCEQVSYCVFLRKVCNVQSSSYFN